jgi:dihydropteroate synthase
MNHPYYSLNEIELKFDDLIIMGVINTTPDSFSDGGRYYSESSAIDHALELIKDGAKIIDIGGESSRPGSDPISVDEELKRTIPVVKKLNSIHKDILISIDTTKSEVAEQALVNGASIINDISGLTFDKKMIDVAKNFSAAVIIMHMKGKPKTMQQNPIYNDAFKEVYDFLSIQSKRVFENGVNKIIIDPGIGFGKSIEDNFTLINRLSEFQSIGYPIMIGLSRKSFIGKTLNLEVEDRDLATVILETVSVLKSARIIRTHNVKYCSQMVKLVNKIIQGK